MTDDSRRYPHLAGALEVEQWAQRVEARTDFPRLIRRLIRQTNDQVVTLEMRAAEGAGIGGFDGVVEASRATPFVPQGRSVWELGVGEPGKKANTEYKNRTDATPEAERATSTFVFATPRRWPGKAGWVARKREEKKWANIQAFDADDIEIAFESAPAAHFWFAELIGLPVNGLRTVENWWAAFSSVTEPPLTTNLVLAGRADEAATLLRVLDAETRVTTISAPSADDVLAFVAATLLSTAEPERADLLGRTLIVYDAVSLRRLDVTTDLLVLLPFEDDLRREAQLVRSHHVVFLAPADAPSDIALPQIDRDTFASALRSVGVGEDQADRLAKSAYRSLVAFQSDAPSRGARRRAWSEPFRSKVVRRAWLAGGWQEARSGDIDALEQLFGISYDDARPELEPFTSGEDPIFTVVGGSWGLTSAEQAWQFARPHLAPQDLSALETLVQTVLGAVDPALELPVTERWAASIHGKSRIHSSDLRRCVATTLAASGALGDERRIGAFGTLAEWTSAVVAQLLRRANENMSGDLWASLTDVLPLLAEAAPEAFMRAVEEGTQRRSEPVLSSMFLDQDDGGFSVSSPHTGLLWALESLAWSEKHAPRAIKLLATLAELDPGGKLSNRPANSLVDIFRTWCPQTSLSLSRRISVLDALRRDHEQVAWKLMLTMLLVREGATGSFTHSPRFRQWKPDDEGVRRPADEWQASVEASKRLLDDVDNQPGRWPELIGHLADFPAAERTSALDQLSSLSRSEELEMGQRESIWTRLDKLERAHRKFAGARWSLPSDELDRISAVAGLFAPDDPVDANTWLFDEHFPDLGSTSDDYETHRQRIEAVRAEAVRTIEAASGIDGLIRLARSAKLPAFVGTATGSLASPALDEHLVPLLDDEDPGLINLAWGYCDRRSQSQGMGWVKERLTLLEGRPAAQARLLQTAPDLAEAWQLASELGEDVEGSYWREFSPMGRGADFALVNEAAAAMLRFGRVVGALNLLNLYVRSDDRRVSPDLVIDALERLTVLPQSHDEPIQQLSSYELNGLLDYIRDASVSEDRLATLEWQLLPALGYDAQSPVLERQLARDPKFFVEILSLVFKPKNNDREGDVQPHVAQNAYRLLDQWRIIPGSTAEGEPVDAAALSNWTEETRRLLVEADRAEVGDVYIGHVLAHAPGDHDGTWPTRPVRDLIERVASPDLDDGFRTEIFNKRGGTSRGLFDGGAQERVLAQQYNDWATRIADEWPRTAAVLSDLARGYEHDARREDDEAERRREGMDR